MAMDGYTIVPIAYVRSDYNEKFGIPKQCGLVTGLEQAVVIEPGFSNIDALRGIETFEYIWLIWGFSGNRMDMAADDLTWRPTVRPPRLGGEKHMGVWASRSPYRPNSLGLSSVKFLRIELDGQPVSSMDLSGPVRGELAVIVSGADLMNGTPVYDIKPYMSFSDCHPDAGDGYSAGAKDPCLEVEFPEELLAMIDENKREGLLQLLRLDPRDAYGRQSGSVYGISFADWNIRFIVEEEKLRVTEVTRIVDV